MTVEELIEILRREDPRARMVVAMEGPPGDTKIVLGIGLTDAYAAKAQPIKGQEGFDCKRIFRLGNKLTKIVDENVVVLDTEARK